MKTLQDFFYWETTSRDTIDFKKIYVDMAAGDVIAGLCLSEIVFWHLPTDEGASKLRVERDGKMWIACRRYDWWTRARLSPHQADRGINILKKKGIVETAVYKFDGEPTKHIRIVEGPFLELWEETKNKPPDNPYLVDRSVFRSSGKRTPRKRRTISPEAENDLRPSGSPVTETPTEITTKTTDPAPASGGAAGEIGPVTLTERPGEAGAILTDAGRLEALADAVAERLEHRVVVAARRVAAEENAKTREYVEKSAMPKAARVASAETIETLRRNGVSLAPKRRRAPDVGRGAGQPPPNNLFPMGLEEFAEICVTMLVTQGQSFDATIEQLMTPGGGGLTPDEAPAVRQRAEAMHREQFEGEVPNVRVVGGAAGA